MERRQTEDLQASASGKIILFGEHAVVYGQPAIAVPVTQVQATASLSKGPASAGLILELPDVGERLSVAEAPASHPLAHVCRLTAKALALQPLPDWVVTLRSTIPVASGLGSGAAAATALVRVLARAAHQPLPPSQVATLVYESEILYHGTPSGIDNTVIAYEQPVWFVRDRPPQPFAIGWPFTVLIADTGLASPTSTTVGDVRRGWQADPQRYEILFERVGRLVQAGRQAIELGTIAALGPLMDENHRLLAAMGVSCHELDVLQQAAKDAGALGAKLSGGGRGGNLIALPPQDEEDIGRVAAALGRSGAVSVLASTVGARPAGGR
jgi:mevalonate kinase